MLTSPTSILSEIQTGKPISEKTRAFYRRRIRNLFHRLIVRAFREQEKNIGLTQKQLADRIDSSPAQINRWLGMPNNWTLNTISDLLLGMAVDLDDPSYTSIADLVAQSANTQPENTIAKEEKQADRKTEFSSFFSLPETKMELTSHLLAELNIALKTIEETQSGSGSGSMASVSSSASAGTMSDATKIPQKQTSNRKVAYLDEWRELLRPKAGQDDRIYQSGAR